MATERYEYGVCDFETGITWPMPWDWCGLVADHTGSTVMRRVERTDGTTVAHGEWHPVETAGGK